MWGPAHGERVDSLRDGPQGGEARAGRFNKSQIARWGKLGGRPAKLNAKALAGLRQMRAKGKTHAERAEALGVSVRTIGRVQARIKASKDGTAT